MSYSNPLAAYLTGEATDEQIAIVEAWAEADWYNQELLNTLEEAWNNSQLDLDSLPFIDDSWSQEMVEEED
jgi:hypothetical protein